MFYTFTLQSSLSHSVGICQAAKAGSSSDKDIIKPGRGNVKAYLRKHCLGPMVHVNPKFLVFILRLQRLTMFFLKSKKWRNSGIIGQLA